MSKQIKYCADRKCPNLMCLRHDKYIPFGIDVIRDTDFGRKKNTDVSCKFEMREE